MERKKSIGSGAGRRVLLFLVSVLLMLFASCTILTEVGAGVFTHFTGIPVSARVKDAIVKSGVAWSKAFEQITPEQEYYIGRSVAANILVAYKIQTNRPALTNYVNQICNALVINTPRPEIYNGYHVAVLDSDEINAFATPGGHIFITRGLINCATSEDTLASIIAHEIAHVQLEHGLKAIQNSRVTQALAVTGTSAVGAALDINELVDIFGESINGMLTTLVTKGYSRDQEYDADTTAMVFLSLAGYEPSSLLSMLEVLEKNQPGKRGGFNDTHPTPAQRITSAKKTVGDFSVTDTRSYREARYKATR